MMDAAANEARVAEINEALRKRGADEIRGPERAALNSELLGLLGADDAQPAQTLAPEKQTRAQEINQRLTDHVKGKLDCHLDVFERNSLARELSDILLAEGAASAETEK